MGALRASQRAWPALLPSARAYEFRVDSPGVAGVAGLLHDLLHPG